jgi:hypothetical protein
MRVVELYASAAELGDTFGAMRIWLDENRCDAGKFETTTTSPGLIRIRMELLVDSDHQAAAFQQRFDAPRKDAAAA